MTDHVAGRPGRDSLSFVEAFRRALGEEDAAAPSGSTPHLVALIDTARKFPARSGCADLPWRPLAELIGQPLGAD